MRLFVAMFAIGSLLSTASCADAPEGPTDSTEPPTAGPTSDPAADTAPPVDPAVKMEARRKIQALLRAGTASVSLAIPLGPGSSVRERAVYSIDPLAVDSLRTIEQDGATLRVHFLSAESRAWLRVEGGSPNMQDWACWVDVEDLALLGDLPFPASDLSGGPHAAAVLASRSKGQRRSPTRDVLVDGTTDLATAVALLGGSKALGTFGLDPQDPGRVPVTLELGPEHLTSMEIVLADLPAALDAAGATPIMDISPITQVEESMTVSFDEIGEPVSIRPPAAT